MERDSEFKTVEKIRELITLKDKDVLEAGCGDGWFTGLLYRDTATYTAIDPDVDALEQAQINNPGARFMLGSGEDLPFESGSFDVVLFTLSLHHQNAGLALTEAARVLRNGGKALVVEPAANGEAQKVFNLFNDESEALAKAADSAKASVLKLEKEEVLSSKWKFEDLDEMIEFDFGWKGGTSEEDAERKIRSLLGVKADKKPIILDDKLIYFLLAK